MGPARFHCATLLFNSPLNGQYFRQICILLIQHSFATWQGGEPRQDRRHHPRAGVPGERRRVRRGAPAEPPSDAAVGAAAGGLFLLAFHRSRVLRRVEEEDTGGAWTGDNDSNFHECCNQ